MFPHIKIERDQNAQAIPTYHRLGLEIKLLRAKQGQAIGNRLDFEIKLIQAKEKYKIVDD
jgi:hypothetical protein